MDVSMATGYGLDGPGIECVMYSAFRCYFITCCCSKLKMNWR